MNLKQNPKLNARTERGSVLMYSTHPKRVIEVSIQHLLTRTDFLSLIHNDEENLCEIQMKSEQMLNLYNFSGFGSHHISTHSFEVVNGFWICFNLNGNRYILLTLAWR